MYQLDDILIGRTNIVTYKTARASDVTVKVKINIFELKTDCCKDTVRSFCYKTGMFSVKQASVF